MVSRCLAEALGLQSPNRIRVALRWRMLDPCEASRRVFSLACWCSPDAARRRPESRRRDRTQPRLASGSGCDVPIQRWGPPVGNVDVTVGHGPLSGDRDSQRERPWTRSPYANVAGWLALRVAVLTYDKRGVGQSEGSCCPYTDSGYFPLLAQDVLAGVRRIAQHPDVRADLIGLFGFSQGGWVVPIAAAEAPTEVAFTIVGSGPAVSLGEELLYSQLSGEDRCQASGLPPEDIERALTNAGPSGFDPRSYLERMTRPQTPSAARAALWHIPERICCVRPAGADRRSEFAVLERHQGRLDRAADRHERTRATTQV